MLLPAVLNSIAPMLMEKYVRNLLECNEKTKDYGLKLTLEEAKSIIDTRNNALLSHGRVDLGIDAAMGIIETFYTSSYINAENYVSTINEVQEIFYYMKNETEDLIADDKLIQIIKSHFENTCGGSIELLKSTLDEFAANFRRKAGMSESFQKEGE